MRVLIRSLTLSNKERKLIKPVYGEVKQITSLWKPYPFKGTFIEVAEDEYGVRWTPNHEWFFRKEDITFLRIKLK